jgi:hypothetical protein
MMETLQKRPKLLRLVVIVAFVGLFMVINPMLKPKPVTGSDNFQFDEWMRYFMRQPGYTVEYLDFDTFEEGVDVMKVIQTMNAIADHLTLYSLGPDYEDAYHGAVRTGRSGVINEALKVRTAGDYPVTIYYDDEMRSVFYIGLGSDPDLTYGYYSLIR